MAALLARGKLFQDRFGDINAVAREHDTLRDNEVVLLVLGESLDDIADFDVDLLEYFILADIQVIAKFVLRAFQLAALAEDLALLAAALGLAACADDGPIGSPCS